MADFVVKPARGEFLVAPLASAFYGPGTKTNPARPGTLGCGNRTRLNHL